MSEEAATSCANCQRLHEQVQALQKLLVQQQQAAVSLTEQVRSLQEKLASARKDSSTSSKPPSSDIVKPPKPAPPGQAKRKQGGQPGHPKHERAAFPPEQLTSPPFDHVLSCCPGCGHAVCATGGPPRTVQQVDLRLIPLDVQEHRGHPAWCPKCCQVHYAPLPDVIERGGLIGPNLTTLIAYLKGVCHASYATTRKFLRDVVGLSISRGQLAKVIAKVSDALEQPYQELIEDLPAQAVLNVDETGHKDRGQAMWAWCFRASLYTLFKIDPRRSADVLIEVLGREFDGVLGCDYFGAYRRYMREFGVKLQFCLAHLIRDVKYLMTLPDCRDQRYGAALRLALRWLFGVIHRRQELSEEEFQRQLEAARKSVLTLAQCGASTPATQAIKARFEQFGESYFRFITTPGVEPTNNLAEQAIRFVVIDRHITQGTRGETGQRWSERMWTVIATCVRQGRSVLDYLRQAVQAHWQGAEAPSLLPQKA
jgi:transposase